MKHSKLGPHSLLMREQTTKQTGFQYCIYQKVNCTQLCFREGSLKVEYEVIMSASDQSVQQFGVATQSLPHTPLGVISNQMAVSVTMTVDGGIGKLLL